MLFSEPKIPQYTAARRERARGEVSVLFSEPKIPQLKKSRSDPRWKRSFSALQRAENSSIVTHNEQPALAGRRFSALQRAENSSIGAYLVERWVRKKKFQCSSASRKFLNCRVRGMTKN